MDLTLSEAFTYYLSARKRSFFARVINALTCYVRPGLGTVAVGLHPDGKYAFYCDPEFLASPHVMPQNFELILEHEVYHIILGHIPRFLAFISRLVNETEKQRVAALFNYAADFADNELMRHQTGFDRTFGPWFYKSDTNLYGFLIPEDYNLPRNQTLEQYLRLLMEEKLPETVSAASNATTNASGADDADSADGADDAASNDSTSQKTADQQDSFNKQTHDSHQFWMEGSLAKTEEELQGLAEKLQNEAKTLIRKAVEDHQKSRGTFPAGLEEIIKELLRVPVIPWPTILRSLCIRTRQTKLSRGMARPSRRLHGIHGILPFPGRARDNRFTIWFVLDTSGSMDLHTDIALGLTHLLQIKETEQDVFLHVMYCDADLQTVYNVKSIDDIDLTVKGRGGTDFNPPFVYLRDQMQTDKAPDVLIYCTDGYAPAPDPSNRVPIPVIWLLTPNGVEPSPDYGTHLRMEPFK